MWHHTLIGLALILFGGYLLARGAARATKWVDAQQSDQQFFGLAFLSTVVAPILFGAIFIVMGLQFF